MQLAGVFNILVFLFFLVVCVCCLAGGFKMSCFDPIWFSARFSEPGKPWAIKKCLPWCNTFARPKRRRSACWRKRRKWSAFSRPKPMGYDFHPWPNERSGHFARRCRAWSLISAKYSWVWYLNNFNFRAKRQCCDSSFSETPTTCPAGVFPVSWAWWRIENLSAAWRQTARSVLSAAMERMRQDVGAKVGWARLGQGWRSRLNILNTSWWMYNWDQWLAIANAV